MLRRRDVSLVAAVLVLTIISTGTKANKQRDGNADDQGTTHHHHHHQHHHHSTHHRHGNIMTSDDDGKDVTSQEDNDLLPSYQDDYQDEEEDFYDDYSSRRELFQLTDKDGDGFVTKDEYMMQNGNHSSVVDQVFMAYDGDRDGKFSEEEFVQGSSPLAVNDECEERIIQTCDKLYMEFRTIEPKANQVGETACRAVQYLVDCVAGYDTGCDIMGYAQEVASRAQAYLDSDACPLLDIHVLLKVTGQDALTDGRKTRFARSIDDVEVTTISDQQLHTKQCSKDFINRCTVKFHKSLVQDTARDSYCLILTNYGHCLNKRARLCPGAVDGALLRLSLLQRAAKTCRKSHQSWATQ